LLPGWHTLLMMRALTGVALAGIPGIAMTYVAEECDNESIGSAMGLYIAGSAIGGMAGRIGITALSELFGWRAALGTLGALALAGAVVFVAAAPGSRAFTPHRHTLFSFIAAGRRLMRDKALRWLYLEGFLLMGGFVTIYNYVGFRLLAPPYRLTQSEVGLIFLLYIVGSISSAYIGGLAGRIGRRKLFWAPITAMIAGIAITAAHGLVLIVAGIGVVTGAFFGAHSIASGWVGRRAAHDKALASSLYLLFYYAGSSILGSVGGLAWTHGGWPEVALFSGGLATVALLVALRLIAVKPLPEPAPAQPGRIVSLQNA
jgi:MFS transporter, YNFM family, putative membrane transport protein